MFPISIRSYVSFLLFFPLVLTGSSLYRVQQEQTGSLHPFTQSNASNLLFLSPLILEKKYSQKGYFPRRVLNDDV
jgi:hypothetical protein